MRNGVLLFSFVLFTFHQTNAQTYLTLADNTAIESNSDIKILGGDYTITDYGNDGLLQISDAQNITIDGDSVSTNGVNYVGYVIRISNSSNIIIKNFSAATHYKY